MMPPSAGNVQAEIISATNTGSATMRNALLKRGPRQRARLRLKLLIMQRGRPLPIFLTNRPGSPWLNTAVRRGYLVCHVDRQDPGALTPAFGATFVTSSRPTRLEICALTASCSTYPTQEASLVAFASGVLRTSAGGAACIRKRASTSDEIITRLWQASGQVALRNP